MLKFLTALRILFLLPVSMMPILAKADYVLTKDPSFGAQAYLESKAFPDDWIKQRFNENMRITATSFRNGKWTIIMSADTGYTHQSYIIKDIFPYAWTDEKRLDKFFITNVASTGTNLLVVMSRGAEFTDQEASNNSSFTLPKAAEGYRLTALTRDNGKFYPIVSSGSKITDQITGVRTSFPSIFISDNWEKGFRITSLFYYSGWYIVMSKTHGPAWAEKYGISEDKLQAELKNGWKIKLSY